MSLWFRCQHWWYTSRFSRMYLAQSGYMTKRAGTVRIGKEQRPFILEVLSNGMTLYSVEELQSGAILCRECGTIILFEEHVGLVAYDAPPPNLHCYHNKRTHQSVVCARCFSPDPTDLQLVWDSDPSDPESGGCLHDCHLIGDTIRLG